MRPLEGFRVIDFGIAVIGGLTTMLLGDLGADVIKVEPLEGDFLRLTDLRQGDSVRWMGVNRSKRSIALNLKDERGREIVRRLLKSVDVLFHNFRPGVMERLGLGYQDVARLNPCIIYFSLYGYGEKGPLAHRVSGDMWAQAMAGVVATQGSSEGPPYMCGTALVDHGGAMLAAFGIVTALLQRERTAVGREITTNLLDAAICLQAAQVGDWLIDGRLMKKWGRGWMGNFPYGAYRCEDGDIVTIDGASDDTWPVFCELLGLEHLLTDPRYATVQQRRDQKEELYPILDQAFQKKTRAEWQNIFRQRGLRADPCLDYAELFEHPQVRENDMIIETEHPSEGRIKMIGLPLKFKHSPVPSSALRHPPSLGEHTTAILAEAGYAPKEIEAFLNDGVAGVSAPQKTRSRWGLSL